MQGMSSYGLQCQSHLISVSLYGVATIQVYMYFQRYNRDHLALKLMVSSRLPYELQTVGNDRGMAGILNVVCDHPLVEFPRASDNICLGLRTLQRWVCI